MYIKILGIIVWIIAAIVNYRKAAYKTCMVCIFSAGMYFGALVLNIKTN